MIQLSEDSVGKYLESILKQEKEVDSLTKLIDAECKSRSTWLGIPRLT